MPLTLPWLQGGTSFGDLLTTELNALANGSYSAFGATVLDNATTKARWWAFLMTLANPLAAAPSAGASLTLFLAPSLDGTNYADAASANNPAWEQTFNGALWVPVTASGTGARFAITPRVELLPIKYKAVLLNSLGASASLAATGNKVTAYYF